MKISFPFLAREVRETLEKYQQARNCDVVLTALLWCNFYKRIVFKGEENEHCIKLRDMKRLPSEDKISRIRRKLNEEDLYLPTSLSVVVARRIQEEKWLNAMRKDFPELVSDSEKQLIKHRESFAEQTKKRQEESSKNLADSLPPAPPMKLL